MKPLSPLRAWLGVAGAALLIAASIAFPYLAEAVMPDSYGGSGWVVPAMLMFYVLLFTVVVFQMGELVRLVILGMDARKLSLAAVVTAHTVLLLAFIVAVLFFHGYI